MYPPTLWPYIQSQVNRPILPVVVPFSPHTSKWAVDMKNIWDAFFVQEYPTLTPHHPLTAFSLGGKNLKQILTRTNITNSLGVDPTLVELNRPTALTPQPQTQNMGNYVWPETPSPLNEMALHSQIRRNARLPPNIDDFLTIPTATTSFSQI